MSERRIMDPQQLLAATRAISRLMRKKPVSRKPKPTDELPDDHKQTMHLVLYKADLARLDEIAGRLKSDPLLGPMRIEPGREKAALYAIAQCAETGPKRITATG